MPDFVLETVIEDHHLAVVPCPAKLHITDRSVWKRVLSCRGYWKSTLFQLPLAVTFLGPPSVQGVHAGDSWSVRSAAKHAFRDASRWISLGPVCRIAPPEMFRSLCKWMGRVRSSWRSSARERTIRIASSRRSRADFPTHWWNSRHRWANSTLRPECESSYPPNCEILFCSRFRPASKTVAIVIDSHYTAISDVPKERVPSWRHLCKLLLPLWIDPDG